MRFIPAVLGQNCDQESQTQADHSYSPHSHSINTQDKLSNQFFRKTMFIKEIQPRSTVTDDKKVQKNEKIQIKNFHL